jgi:hypothetical protein
LFKYWTKLVATNIVDETSFNSPSAFSHSPLVASRWESWNSNDKKAPPLFEGTLRMSNVCDDGSFSSPKECRQAYLQTEGSKKQIKKTK